MEERATMNAPHLILYSRSYCHLCEDMLIALRSHFPQQQYTLDVKDVDQLPGEILALYDELVPVLMACDPDGGETELCHYFLDVERVADFFAQIRG